MRQQNVVLVRSAGTGGRRGAGAPAGLSHGKMDCSTVGHGRNSHKRRTRPDTPGSHRFSFGEPSPPRGLHVPFRHYAPSVAAHTGAHARVRGKGGGATGGLGESPENYVFWGSLTPAIRRE